MFVQNKKTKAGKLLEAKDRIVRLLEKNRNKSGIKSNMKISKNIFPKINITKYLGFDSIFKIKK